MKDLLTAGGRLFSATVEGAPTTLRDAMVAAPLYVRLLEEDFSSAELLLLCFRAWRDDAQGPVNLCDQQLERVRRWAAAHARAGEVAEQWLSDPDRQSFRFQLAATD